MATGRLMTYLKLNAEEEKDFKLLFIQSLISGFGASFFFVVVNTYFIKKTSVQSLPPGYILSGIFGYLLITMYKKWQKKSGVVFAYTLGYVIYGLAGLLLFSGRMFFADTSPVAVVIAYIGFVVVLPFASMQAIGFSTICLRVFNIAQSKRLLALIGTGEVFASIIAYLIIPWITKIVGGAAPLLLFSGIMNFLAILPLRRTYRNNKHRLDTIKFGSNQVKMNLDFFRKDKFYMMIAVVTVFSVLAIYFADYAYLLSVRYISAESAIEVGTVVAVIFSIIKTGELVASLLSGSVIRSYGIRISLLVLPAVLVTSSLIGSVTGILFLSIPFFLVIFLLLNKWCERVIRKGVTVPAMKVVYQVTNPDDRAQLQTSIDGTISQYATIAAGVFLLIVSSLIHSSDVMVFLRISSIIYIAAFAGWLWFTYKLCVIYKVRIGDYLKIFGNAQKRSSADDAEADTVVTQSPVNKGDIGNPVLMRAAAIQLPRDANQYFNMLACYNPALRSLSERERTFGKITSVYYNNENIFSRYLVLRVMASRRETERLDFVKEYYRITELPLRQYVIGLLTENDFLLKKEDEFYFVALCQDTVTEIMSAESALYDLKNTQDQPLIAGLENQIRVLRDLLFGLLSTLYEKDAIAMVHNIVNARDQSLENQLFAIELLDNVLNAEMKQFVMPVIEDISYHSKKSRLEKLILIYNLSPADRLKEILMTDFRAVNPVLKEYALRAYFRLTGDRTILNAFFSSYLENLNATSRELAGLTPDVLYQMKLTAGQQMGLAEVMLPSLQPYFFRWGFYARNRKRGGASSLQTLNKLTYQYNEDFQAGMHVNDADLNIDLLGLALFLGITKNN